MPSITKSPPWETFYNEVAALFKGDRDIQVVRSYPENGDKVIRVIVGDRDKYMLLSKYLVDEKLFGTTKVKIVVIDPNGAAKTTAADDMRTIFAGNNAVSRVKTENIPGGNVTYVAFKNGVVQFKDDNLADINGNKTMLMETIARDVFKLPVDGVYFCTDKPDVSESKYDKKTADILNRIFNAPLY